MVMKNIDDGEQKHTVVELSENIFIFMDKCKEKFSEEELWEDMQNKLKPITKMKVKEHAGLSNKSLFKFMDITDIKV